MALEHFLSSTAVPLLHQLRIRNGVQAETLVGAETLTARSANFLALDPGGSNRNVDLPAEEDSEGLQFSIYNSADADEDLVIRNDAAATIVTINQGEFAIVGCDGAAWFVLALTGVDVSAISVDTINESTTAAGVTVDGVLLKDGALTGARRAANTTAVAITGATVLALDDSGGIFTVAQSSAYDIDLPSPTTGPGLRYMFSLTAPGSFDVTITSLGGATFVGTILNDATVVVATGSTLTFADGVSLLGDNIEIESISTSLWHVRAVASVAAGITAT
jgi:hypothetical protein